MATSKTIKIALLIISIQCCILVVGCDSSPSTSATNPSATAITYPSITPTPTSPAPAPTPTPTSPAPAPTPTAPAPTPNPTSPAPAPTPTAPAPTPTLITYPTTPPTPGPQIYLAQDIYSAFSNAGIGMTNPQNDTDWHCCTYYPEGGALVWTDVSTGLSVDIATFNNAQESQIDGDELRNQGLAATYDQNCLLSYETSLPQNELALYTTVMARVCT